MRDMNDIRSHVAETVHSTSYSAFSVHLALKGWFSLEIKPSLHMSNEIPPIWRDIIWTTFELLTFADGSHLQVGLITVARQEGRYHYLNKRCKCNNRY